MSSRARIRTWTWESRGRTSPQAALSAEVIGWNFVEELFLWQPRQFWRSLGMRDAKGVSDSEYVLLVGEKGDYPHSAFAARTL
jgi:hypothetical protein